MAGLGIVGEKSLGIDAMGCKERGIKCIDWF
jgi:hypothetical protein